MKDQHGNKKACMHAMYTRTIAVFIPLAHTLLMVVQDTCGGRPANTAACRAGACPIPNK